MRIQLGVALIAAGLFVSPAFAQKVERVTANRPASPVMRDHPAMANGFSPLVAAAMLDKVCAPARDKLEAADRIASSSGLSGMEAPARIRWALPEGARVWRVDSLDSEVFLYAYGPKMTQCGVAISRPLGAAIASKLRDQLGEAGYAVESEQTMQAGVHFTRLKSAGFRYADLMEYPANGDAPGLLKIELLPLS